MFGRGITSAAEEFMERQMRRDMERRNTAVGRMIEEVERRMSDPRFQMMQRASEEAAVRAKERCLWYYRRTTDLISFADIHKVVNKLLEQLFPKKFDPESFANRVRAALSVQDNCNGIVKVHSPPLRLISKTLHPIESVA
jgi:hypothetical protein